MVWPTLLLRIRDIPASYPCSDRLSWPMFFMVFIRHHRQTSGQHIKLNQDDVQHPFQFIIHYSPYQLAPYYINYCKFHQIKHELAATTAMHAFRRRGGRELISTRNLGRNWRTFSHLVEDFTDLSLAHSQFIALCYSMRRLTCFCSLPWSYHDEIISMLWMTRNCC